MDRILYIIKKFIPKKIFKALQPAYHFVLNWLAALVYRFPSEELIVIGVTGTTGKTTSAYLMAKMLENNGYKTGFTSTAMFNNGKKEWLNDKKMTMIGRFFTQRILRQMVNNGCRYAIVETTSEGIVQFRHRFINYDLLVFTGLYEEHIESHGSFENYKKAKGRLFAHLKKCRPKYSNEDRKIVKTDKGLKKLDLNRVEKTIIANGDDEHCAYFLSFWAEKKIAYMYDKTVETDGIRTVIYKNIKIDGKMASFETENTVINLQLLGDFNVRNAMNALCLGLSLGIDINKIKRALESISGVAGRLEKIDEGQNYTVIVDYAFEPGALSNLYNTLKYLPHNNIIHVLGSAGGGRDIARRPKLGKLAGENAEYVIVTNEDPYDDDPRSIIGQVALGAEKAGKIKDKDLLTIPDRREAIKKALKLAREGDIVLVTGKGSEQAICLADGEKMTWDDRAVIRALLTKNK